MFNAQPTGTVISRRKREREKERERQTDRQTDRQTGKPRENMCKSLKVCVLAA